VNIVLQCITRNFPECGHCLPVARDQAIKQLSSAVAKYHEIRDSIHNAGIQFYLSLQVGMEREIPPFMWLILS
jgi:hypothetical protein